MKEYYRLEHEREFARNTIAVNWCLLNVCNYRCSYCPKFLHSGSTGFPDLYKVEMFCAKIIDHYENKNVHFEFTGGEVTFWKDFPKLVEFLKNNADVYVGAISNGSNSLKWWDGIKDNLDNACLSFQPEFSNRSHYVDLTKLINDHVRTHINLMMSPEHFDLCIDVVEEIVRDVPNISVALQPLLVDFKNELYKYTPEQLDIMDRQFELYGSRVKWNIKFPVFRGSMKMIGKKQISASPHIFIAEGTNRWKGWKCYAGVEQIVVDTNGEVWRGWCFEGGSIKDKLPTEPIICTKDYCHCNFDIMCTKEKI